MYEDILKQAKENCDKRFNKEVIENWSIKEFTPTHAYNYMYMCEATRLIKEQYKEDIEKVMNTYNDK